MLPPELLRTIHAFLTKPLALAELSAETVQNPGAAWACTDRQARDAVGICASTTTTVVTVAGPPLLFQNWLRLEPRTECQVLVGECLGHVLLKLCSAWGLPPTFFVCGLDMRAPAPQQVHLDVDLKPSELIVIVDDYLRFPYEQYISKFLKETYVTELRKMYEPYILLRDTCDGQVLLLDAI